MLINSACITVYRACPDYNYPSEEQWVPGSNGTIYRFESANGEVQEYKLDNTHTNEAYRVGTIRSKLKRTECSQDRSVRLVSTENSHGFNVSERQNETISNSENTHFVSASSYILEDGEIVKLQKLGLAFISSTLVNSTHRNGNGFDYHSKLVVNGKTYSNVFSLKAVSTKQIQYFVNEIVIAKGHGLIQFERRDGTVFNLVSIN